MKNKLMYLTKMSFFRKVKTKWFLGTNILLALVICLVINIESVITFFGGDFSEKTKIYIMDNTNYSYETLKTQIETSNSLFTLKEEDKEDYEISLYEKTKEELKSEIEKDNGIIGIIIDEDDTNYLKATMISEAYLDTSDYQLLYTAINNSKVTISLTKSNINIEELNSVYKDIEINREYLDQEKKSEDENMTMVMSTVFPIIILPFFMLTVFLVQMIGAEINDEKTTRGMEIIISNVSPKTHFFSKVLVGNVFVVMQGLLLILYVVIGLFINSIVGTGGLDVTGVINSFLGDILTADFINKLIYLIPLTLVLMLITFIGYSLVAGILSSITTNTEDFQQIQIPIMVILLIGYYLAIMSPTFEGAIFIKVIAYVPFISAILAPSLLVMGQMAIYEVIIAIVFMLITIWLLIKYGIKVYKVGILNYSSEGLWKKIFKAVKNNER